MAWGGHENWAADRGCHAATCSWKEIPRKHGCIHGRSSPNPLPAQVTKPAPRRIGGTQAHKLLLRGFNSTDRKPCHNRLRSGAVRAHASDAGHVISPSIAHLKRTSLPHIRYAIALPFPTNVKAHAPLPAGAHVDHGVGVVVTENHRNRAAGRGCHGASCSASWFWESP